MVSLAFVAALKVLIFHLTREEAKVPNPIGPFLPSPCTESLLGWVALLEPNAEAAIEDLLRDPRLSAAARMSDLPVRGVSLDWPVASGIGKFDAPPTDSRLEREDSFEEEREMNFDEELCRL